MRWNFERGGRTMHAVRAVDTATHPDYQGMRLFTKLTLGALDALRNEGVDFVFNTPNDQSRPGYLKMGWSVVGRLAVPSRPLSLRGAVRMARARVPAVHFSSESAVGAAASDVLADDVTIGALLAARPHTTRLRTALSLPVLRWRYGGDLLRYRVVVASSGPRDGIAIVRVRKRGDAHELAVALVLAPDPGSGAGRRGPDAARGPLRGRLRDRDRGAPRARGSRRSRGPVPRSRGGPSPPKTRCRTPTTGSSPWATSSSSRAHATPLVVPPGATIVAPDGTTGGNARHVTYRRRHCPC